MSFMTVVSVHVLLRLMSWAVVNTRTLFYKPASYQDALREDCMCLCPFIDYFNHSDEGVDRIHLKNSI